MNADGLITLRSSFGHHETVTRLETAIRANGMRVFARIDHDASPAEAGAALRQTTLLIYGDAQDWAPLMRARVLVAIDLPFKALVWQDTKGETWLSYDDPQWLAKRHGVERELECLVVNLGIRISSIARKAASPP